MTELQLQPPRVTSENLCAPNLDTGELSSIGPEVEKLRHKVLEVEAELEATRTQLASSHAALVKISGDFNKISEALRTSQKTVETIFRSRSWRWLAPIRRLNAVVRSYRRRMPR